MKTIVEHLAQYAAYHRNQECGYTFNWHSNDRCGYFNTITPNAAHGVFDYYAGQHAVFLSIIFISDWIFIGH